MDSFLNLYKLNQEEALNLAKFFINSGNNLCLFGKKGLGKTSIAFQAAKSCKLKVNYVNLSVMDRSDFLGIPDINAIGSVISYKSPYFLQELIGTKPDSILIFDEIDKCPPEITYPLLEILQFKTINGKKINAKGCILTANLISEISHSNEVSRPLLDRCAKYELTFSFEKWIDWCKANNVNDLIISFLCNNQNLVLGDDEHLASVSPRSWVLASDAINAAKTYKISSIEEITQIMAGFVGYTAALKFKHYYEYYKKYENIIFSVLERKAVFDINTLFGTEKLVFLTSITSLAKYKVLTTKNLDYLENLVDFLDNVDIELIIHAISSVFTFDIITKNHLYKCNKFLELYKRVDSQLK